MQCVCMSSRSSSLSSDPSVSNMATDKTHEMLEDENERLMSEMARKIDTLKTVRSIKKKQINFYRKYFQLSIDIGDEVKGQNKFMTDMVSFPFSVPRPPFSVPHSGLEWNPDRTTISTRREVFLPAV